MYKQNNEKIEKRKIKTIENLINESKISTFSPEINPNSDRIMSKSRRSNSLSSDNLNINHEFNFENLQQKNEFLRKVEKLKRQKKIK